MICKIHPQGLCVFTARMATATSSVLRVIIIVNFTFKQLTWTTHDVYYLEPHVLFVILTETRCLLSSDQPGAARLCAARPPLHQRADGLVHHGQPRLAQVGVHLCSFWWGALMSGILAMIFKRVKWVGRWCRNLWLDHHPTMESLAWHDFGGTFPICGMLE